MGSFGDDDDEDYRFMDAHENLVSISDSDSESYCLESPESKSKSDYGEFGYDFWSRSPASVEERRSKFLRWMESSSDSVLSTATLEDQVVLSSESSLADIGNSDSGIEFRAEESMKSGELENIYGVSSPVQRRLQGEIEVDVNKERMTTGLKKRWLSRLRSSMTRVVTDRRRKIDDLRTRCSGEFRKVRVHRCGKQSRELSAFFTGQDIQAHEGSISTMKFSPDGQFLASAGGDGIVRVWQVVNQNLLPKLALLAPGKHRASKSKSLKTSVNSAFFICPPKIFPLSENPLHEFHGHSAKILDLSWSKNNFLLSSSVDKTVRLWQVGCDQCLKVFPHSNYVTCIQFNPVNNNHFISGSIDGKVRIWAIESGQVIAWAGTREIITAISYRPDGQGGIVGSLTGTCRFFTLTDNQFQLEVPTCLNSKKSPCKRITAVQFFAQDARIVMVSSADSQVRILHGTNVLCKYKGLPNGGNQISAYLTSDSKHIVSTCEDSNIYLWNNTKHGESSLCQPKTIKSFEQFHANASVAIPWSYSGFNLNNGCQLLLEQDNSSTKVTPVSSEHDLFSKGSKTWPEEKLPSSSYFSTMSKSRYKVKTTPCQHLSGSHAWGLVIVAGGQDGRIRTFHNYGLLVSN